MEEWLRRDPAEVETWVQVFLWKLWPTENIWRIRKPKVRQRRGLAPSAGLWGLFSGVKGILPRGKHHLVPSSSSVWPFFLNSHVLLCSIVNKNEFMSLAGQPGDFRFLCTTQCHFFLLLIFTFTLFQFKLGSEEKPTHVSTCITFTLMVKKIP